MYQFAIVGCGQIAKRHAVNIDGIGKVAAVCDIELQKAEELGNLYQSRIYNSLDQLLLQEKEVDVVVVCTPNGLHAEHTIKSLQNGKHVLCEKPMCISLAAARQIVETAHWSRKKVFVVKQNRYNEPVKLVKQLLMENRLGTITGFQVNGYWNRPEEYYKGNWKGTKYLDGGILYTQFSHFIDLLYWFLGDVSEIRSLDSHSSIKRNIEIEDTIVSMLKLKNGAIGTLHFTINAFNHNLEGSFAVFGEKGSIKIGGQYLNTLEWFEVEGMGKPDLALPSYPNQYGFYQGSMSNHHLVYKDLIPSLEGQGTLLEAMEAMKTVEIIEKIYAAINTNNL